MCKMCMACGLERQFAKNAPLLLLSVRSDPPIPVCDKSLVPTLFCGSVALLLHFLPFWSCSIKGTSVWKPGLAWQFLLQRTWSAAGALNQYILNQDISKWRFSPHGGVYTAPFLSRRHLACPDGAFHVELHFRKRSEN